MSLNKKKIRVWIFDSLLVILVFIFLFQTELVVYLFKQAAGQFRILWNTQPVSLILNSSDYAEEEKNKIRLIQKVKTYSEEKLNFNPSRSYSDYYEQNGKYILRIVTACDPFSFTEYKWEFPVVGKVSYKGYFDFVSAEKEYLRLKNSGWDVDVSPVSAWSTLGYFSDPIFSEMLKKSDGELIELIFHELFHGTIYVPGEVESNENMADFVAEKATLMFLKDKPRAAEKYLSEKSAQFILDSFALHCIHSMDSVYFGIHTKNLSDQQQAAEKNRVLGKLMHELKMVSKLPEKMKQRFTERLNMGGNAFLMHFQRYTGLKDSLDKVFQYKYHGNLTEMIKDWKMNIKSL